MRPQELFQRVRLWTLLGLGTASLAACSLLNPFSGGSSLPSVPRLPGTGNASSVAEGALHATGTTIDQIGSFAWLSILLVLFFPKVREPLGNLWSTIFGALAVPFLAVRSWAEKRFAPPPNKSTRKTTKKR